MQAIDWEENVCTTYLINNSYLKYIKHSLNLTLKNNASIK